MREIKFRVWNKDKKCFFVSNHTIGINNENKKIWGEAQLFTGLKDKNGKEIYEGDVLSRPLFNEIAVVQWNPQGFWFPNLDKNDALILECEVIGNIHQNPELIKH